MADEIAKMVEVVVVYARQEYYLQAAVEPGEGILIDLLQCQLLSLIGLLPEQQILATSRGEIIASPHQSLALPYLPVQPQSERVRLFVHDATLTPEIGQLVPLDWQDVCSRCTFGNLPVVQPAYRSIGRVDSDSLLCGACASTCGTDSQPVTPLDVLQAVKTDKRFISELLLVAGESHVPTPPGFEKIPGDLNYSASGDFVHLFVKRGGTRVVTHVHVAHKPRGEPPTQSSRSTKRLPVDCSSASASSVSVWLSYDTVAWSHSEALNSFGITEIVVLRGAQEAPSGFVKIARDLNEAAIGRRVQELYLCYKLAPLGGFACAATHGAFGECLFASRHASAIHSSVAVASGASPQSDAVLASLESARQRADNAFWESHYRQRAPGMRNQLQNALDRVRIYEDPRVQAEALKRIPVGTLHERARANPSPRASYQDELVMQLTHWFKREFFTWMNQPKCGSCGHEKTQMVGSEPAMTEEEKAGEASRVEVYKCPRCAGLTRFPRYNNPVKLLDSRTGRCGEWANCFTLCCRAMGFEARYVLDVTDHVWTEVYSDHLQRWLHCDSCEDQLDAPLTYEVGWGKSLSYVFSFSHEEVVDTARRYTQHWDDMKLRRTVVSEAWLASTIESMNQTLRRTISPDRVRILDQRAVVEQLELQQGRQASTSEIQGRVSGSDEWKSSRKEDGKTHDELSSTEASSSQREDPDAAMNAAGIIQILLKNMLLGCDLHDKCNNPFCLHKRSLTSPELAPTDRAAQALQEIATIQAKGFSTRGLASMLCSPVGHIKTYLLSQDPTVYLPLQDSDVSSSSSPSLLVDVSGHGRHAQSDAPLRKPFRISTTEGKEVKARGVQLLPGSQLTIPTVSLGAMTLSWLMRIDKVETPSHQIEHAVLSIHVSDEISVAIVRKNGSSDEEFYVAARVGDVSTQSAQPVIRSGLYYHVSVILQKPSAHLVVFANGVEALRLSANGDLPKTDDKASPTIMFEGATDSTSVEAAAVISHVTVLRSCDAAFQELVYRQFVSQPPLEAFDSSGARADTTCDLYEARVQSGFRVARVRMWSGDFFDGIQFVYEKRIDGALNVKEGPLVGNHQAHSSARSPTVELALLPSEYIAHVSGRKGAWTDCIILETSFGRRISCGGSGGGNFHVRLPSKRVQIRAVHFDVGDHLVDAVAFVADASVAESDNVLAELKTILETTEPSKREAAISAATRYLGNIMATPHDPKFQKIRASNKFFASSVGVLGITTCSAFMQWCGFTVSHDCGETFYSFQPNEGDASAAAAMRLHYLKALGNTH